MWPSVADSPGAVSDSALAERMAGGDERALAALYDRYGAILFALAYRILGNRDDADEVVLETFTQAWKGAATYSGSRGTVAAWLVVLGRSRALDRLRARGRHTSAVERAAASAPVGETPGMGQPADDPSRRGELAEGRNAVLSALKELPDAQRDCIRLAYYDGLTQTEIAARLSEPLGTVKTRMRLGMMKLKEILIPMAAEYNA